MDGEQLTDVRPVIDGAAPAEAAPAAEANGGVTRLARALGLNRRTVYKLRQRGAPTGVDEPAWRAWCRAHAVPVRAPLTLDLGAMAGADAAADAPRGTESKPPDAAGTADAPVAAGAGGIDPVTSYAQLKNRRDAELKVLQARKVQLEIDEKLRVLIDRDDARRVLAAFALVVLNELVDLPARAVQALPESTPTELRRPLRRAIEHEVHGLRGRVSGHLRRRITDLLDGPAARRPAAPAPPAADEVTDG